MKIKDTNEQSKGNSIQYSLKAVKCTLKETRKSFERVIIKDGLSAVEYARNFYKDDINLYESSFIILLNQSLSTIGYAKISQGGICGTVVDIRIVCKYAIESLATGVILVHNHPSGNCNPSQDDKNIFTKLKSALNTLNINLIDNLIISQNSYYSFTDKGLF